MTPTVKEANDARAVLEHYDLANNPPESFVAYIGKQIAGRGLDGRLGNEPPLYELTLWTGRKIGNATMPRSWRVNSYIGSRLFQIYACAFGREYTGRGFGEGMAIRLKETAESKRKRKAV